MNNSPQNYSGCFNFSLSGSHPFFQSGFLFIRRLVLIDPVIKTRINLSATLEI